MLNSDFDTLPTNLSSDSSFCLWAWSSSPRFQGRQEYPPLQGFLWLLSCTMHLPFCKGETAFPSSIPWYLPFLFSANPFPKVGMCDPLFKRVRLCCTFLQRFCICCSSLPQGSGENSLAVSAKSSRVKSKWSSTRYFGATFTDSLVALTPEEML